MKATVVRRSALLLIYVVLWVTHGACQGMGAEKTGADEFPVIRVQLQGLLDDYVKRIHDAGLSCPIATPTLVIHSIKSWGNYNSESNTITTPAWEQLGPDEAGFFKMLSGPGADDAAAHKTFEAAAHRWIFVHELGHWWQQCRKSEEAPYATEYGANRLAAAYWREVDPAFLSELMPVFHKVYDHGPSPVPTSQTAAGYFDAHYQTLAGTPAYSWYQSQMVITAYEEKPAPTFAEALKQVK
jgi:hypothetical protein